MKTLFTNKSDIKLGCIIWSTSKEMLTLPVKYLKKRTIFEKFNWVHIKYKIKNEKSKRKTRK